MNPKKKSRRYRVSVSIHALDLAISRFTHSLGTNACVDRSLQLSISAETIHTASHFKLLSD
jgi:hypothetical protein